MKKGCIYSWALVVILLTGCAVDVSGLDPNSIGDGNNQNQLISFKSQVVPIFSQDINGTKCTQCHSGDSAFGNLNLNETEKTVLELYEALTFGRVDTTTASNSKILAKPLGQQAHVQLFTTGDQNHTYILNWINAGAPFDDVVPPPTDDEDRPDDPNAPTPTPPSADKSYFTQQIYPLLASCTACHQPGGLSPTLDLKGNNSAATVCLNIKARPGVAVAGNATGSLLYSKPIINTGVAHTGGKIWSANSEGAKLTTWIMQKNASCNMP